MSSVPGIVESLSGAVSALRAGDRRILARMVSAVEDGDPVRQRLLAEVRAQVAEPRAPVLALTGPPGVGKSTLAAALAMAAVADGRTVALLAVDPSSPVTGGAVLGDRVRMAGHATEQIFFRSFANRGVVGGLATVVPAAVELVSAAGFDLVVVETVGVGQSEIDVHRLADVTAVVLAPHMGDEIQAAKAGLLEVADVFLVNKCDLPDAGRAVRQLRTSVGMRQVGEQRTPVLKVTAATGDNVPETWAELDRLLGERALIDRDDVGRAARVALDEVSHGVADLIRSAADRPLESTSVLARLVDGHIGASEALAEIALLLDRGTTRA